MTTGEAKGMRLLFDDYNALREALRDIFVLSANGHEDCGTFRAQIEAIVFKALTGVDGP